MSIFNFLKRNIQFKVVFCGLDNSGKSTIISFLQTGHYVHHTPTMGKARSDIEVEGTRISLYDMGGQTDFRSLWLGELKKASCVIFVIDRANIERFEEAKIELKKLWPSIKKYNIKLILLANKSDLKQAAPLGKIIQDLELNSIDSFEILEISAKTGLGIADAFARIYSILTNKPIKKTVATKAVSIYNKNGVPIFTKLNSATDDQKVLEGGFLSAVTSFANLSLNMDRIFFKGENDNTFIVHRSKNFIGSMLWNPELSVTIDESESVLDDLLSHLEATSNCEDIEAVTQSVLCYCTNIM